MIQHTSDNRSLPQKYFQLTIPVILGLIITITYNLTDLYYVGRTGNTALLAGVSLCSPIFTILMGFGNLYGQGGCSLIRSSSMNQDKERTSRVSSFSFYASMLTSFILTSFMLIFKSEILRMLGTSSDTYHYADQYFTILALGVPVIMLTIVGCNFVCCEGMVFHSILGISCGVLINIILTPILIKHSHMGTKGVAIATITGYMVSNFYYIILIHRKSRFISLEVSDYLISLTELAQILKISAFAVIPNILQSLCIILINRLLVSYGNESIAAMGIAIKLSMISQLILISAGFGGFLLIPHNEDDTDIGDVPYYFIFAKFMKRNRYRFRFLFALSVGISITIYSLAPYLLRLFMNDEAMIQKGTVMLRWQVSGTIFLSFVFLMNVYLHAAGKLYSSFFLSFMHQATHFFVILVFSNYVHNYQVLLTSQLITNIISAFMAIVLYSKVLKEKGL